MTRHRPATPVPKPALAAIVAASLASLATSAPEEPGWAETAERELAVCDIDADGFANYLVESAVEFPADSDMWSIALLARAETSSDDTEPTITVEVRDADSDVLFGSSTRRVDEESEERKAVARVDHPVLEWDDTCEIPESGDGRCEQTFLVRVRVEPEGEFAGLVRYTASGDKETHDDPDPDVAVSLSAQCAGEGA